MGGRGSSSGLGAGGGFGGQSRSDYLNFTKAQRETFPTLTGSEKQVKWANEIRQKAIERADHIVEDTVRKERGEFWRPGNNNASDARSVEGAMKTRDDLIGALKQQTSAAQIIENRNRISDLVEKGAGLYDKTFGTSFKKPSAEMQNEAQKKRYKRETAMLYTKLK